MRFIRSPVSVQSRMTASPDAASKRETMALKIGFMPLAHSTLIAAACAIAGLPETQISAVAATVTAHQMRLPNATGFITTIGAAAVFALAGSVIDRDTPVCGAPGAPGYIRGDLRCGRGGQTRAAAKQKRRCHPRRAHGARRQGRLARRAAPRRRSSSQSRWHD